MFFAKYILETNEWFAVFINIITKRLLAIIRSTTHCC
jgi:hypothetical protein